MIPIALISGHYRYLLIAYNLQKYEFVCSIITAVISVVLSHFLIHRFGENGAAIALVVSASINGLIAYKFVQRKITEIPLLPYLAKPLFAGAAMTIAFLLLLPLNVWLAWGAAIALFAAILFFLQPEVKAIFLAKTPALEESQKLLS